jgi:hypothetical protein
MDRGYVAENDRERARMRELVGGMTDAELSRAMPAGWTVSAVLAHVAYWDARAIYWLGKWASGVEVSAYEPENTEAVNEAAKPLCLALAPRDALRLALRLADESDARVKAISDEMLAKIVATGAPPFNLSRAIHRSEHLDDIERVLRATSPRS